MDIRGFFTPRGGTSKTPKTDNSKEKETPKKEKAKKKVEASQTSQKSKQKKRVVISDSDEDPLPEELREKTPSKKDKQKRKAAVVEPDEEKETSTKRRKQDISEQSKEKSKVLKVTSAEEFFSETNTSPKPSTSKDKSSSKKAKTQTKNESKPLTSNDQERESKKELPESSRPSTSKGHVSESPKKVSLANKLSSKVSESQKKRKDEEQDEEIIKSTKTTEIPKKRKHEEEEHQIAKIKKTKEDVTKTPDRKSKVKEVTPEKKSKTDGKGATRKATGNVDESSEAVTPSEKVPAKKAGYRTFMAREGPQALGTKEIPEGADNCLEGMTFVITGVLDCIERDATSDLIKKCGGKVTQAVSKKTTYLVAGRDPGMSKIDKAEKFGTKKLDEDSLFDLIRNAPGKVSAYDLANKSFESPSSSKKAQVKQAKKSTPKQSDVVPESPNLATTSKTTMQSVADSPKMTTSKPHTTHADDAEELMWVDKYKPKVMKDIIGQHGDKSNANKLYRWLLDWKMNRNPATKPGFTLGKETGAIFKAALLSGSPGIGKTTTATLVCKEANFPFVELNASDARSKKKLDGVIAGSLVNTTIDGLMKGRQKCGEKHVLIMDEVDGMAGNEDRGGIQELIALIKSSKIPIICMCNDRNHPKIRSLANHCFDLRFQKPRLEQIKGFALKVAFKEGVKIPPPAMEQIIIGANQDMRQVLHNLQMWSSTDKSITFENAKSDAQRAHKNIKLGPFEIVRKLLSASDERSKMSIMDKTDLFFMDYSFVPLFIQENYLHCHAYEARGDTKKHLDLLSQAADSIADSNLIEKLIRGSNAWSLLPLQGFYSCVLPCDKVYGGLGHRIDFPQWLGKNSSRSKHDRILQELKTHMMLSMHGNKTDLNLDYLWMLKKRLMDPLADQELEPAEAASSVVEFMDSYSLIREDWDSIVETSKWSDREHSADKIPSKVKAAFTRTYNKGSHTTPYAAGISARKGRSAAKDGEQFGDEDETIVEESDDEDDTDITKDPTIKIGSGKSTRKTASGKGKGSARGGKAGVGKKK